MAVIPITFRHAGKKYNVDVDTDEPGEVLKFQLFSLTGVEPDRQKIVVKGGQIMDDTDLNTLALRPGQTLMLLGTAGEIKVPEKAVFVEDLTDQQLAATSKTPVGLTNLGNTCYLNATLQCLRTMPELRAALAAGAFVPVSPDLVRLVGSLRDLYAGMDSQTYAYYPLPLVQTLRVVFPQFAETDRAGHFKQQDAEEAFSQILSVVSAVVPSFTPYLTGSFETALTCAESDAEPVVRSVEPFTKLDCHITGDTNFLHTGLLGSLTETITKHSDVLGRDAEFTLRKSIATLPKYLTVHFMRFYWRRDTSKKSKILRKVAFPFELDVTELCAPALRTKLTGVRDKLREVRKAKEDLRKSQQARTVLDDDSAAVAKLEAELQAAVDPQLTGCVSGLYELTGVISHKGKSADSGHYQFWSKQEQPYGAQEPKWWRFDDDKVSEVGQAKIEAMAGGGESDSALILLYRAVGPADV